MTRSAEVGRAGEVAALAIMRGNGYEVVATNFRARRGEIDLVCRRGSELVVVEVKTRSSDRFGDPAEAVDDRKRRALGAAAAEMRALLEWRGPITWALLAITMSGGGAVLGHRLIREL